MTNVSAHAPTSALAPHRARTLVLLVLVALTLASFAAGDALGRAAALPILAAALAKSALVGLEFMELRRAHPLLRAAFAALIGAVVLALWIALRRG